MSTPSCFHPARVLGGRRAIGPCRTRRDGRRGPDRRSTPTARRCSPRRRRGRCWPPRSSTRAAGWCPGGWTTSTPIPRRSTTATYAAVVDWPTGRREELLGASARVGGRRGQRRSRGDLRRRRSRGRRLALSGRSRPARAAPGRLAPRSLAALLREHQVLDRQPRPDQVAAGDDQLPAAAAGRAQGRRSTTAAGRRRSSSRCCASRRSGRRWIGTGCCWRPGIPAPPVLAATADFCVVLPQLPGRPLAYAIFDEAMPCTAENLIMLLDAMPPAVAALPRRPPWTDARRARTPRWWPPRCRPPAAQLRWLVDRDQRRAGRHPARPGADPRGLPRGTAVRGRRA